MHPDASERVLASQVAKNGHKTACNALQATQLQLEVMAQLTLKSLYGTPYTVW